MQTVAEKICLLLEQLPEQKQNALLLIIQSMVDPEDILTEDDLKDIEISRHDLQRGEYYTLDDVSWK